MSDKTSPLSSTEIQLDARLPAPPSGMRYILVPEQQVSSAPAQQQQVNAHQCYVCSAVAIHRCFYGTNSVNHCKKMMCLQHAESTVQGPPWGTFYYCQEHYQGYLASQNQCCSLL